MSIRVIRNAKFNHAAIAVAALAGSGAAVAGVLLPWLAWPFALIPFLLLGGCVCVAWGKAFDGLLLTVFLVFLFAQFQIRALDLLRWISLALLIITTAWAARNVALHFNPIAFGLALIAVYAAITSFISYYPPISLLKAISLLMLAGAALLLGAATQRCHPDLDVRGWFLDLLVVIAVGVVVCNALFTLMMPGTAFLAGRYRGWFVNPNGIGAVYGILLLPALTYSVSKHNQTRVQSFLLLVLVLGWVELLATQSRAGIASAVIALTVFLYGEQKAHWAYGVFSLGLLVLAVAQILDPNDNLAWHMIARNETVLAGSGRFDVWAEMWPRIMERPILGSGFGVAQTGSDMQQLAFSSAAYTIEKGNSYLGMLEELGVVGFVLFCGGLVAPLLHRSREILLQAPSIERLAALTLVAIGAAGLANAFFEAWLLSVGGILGLVFWLGMALLFYPGRKTVR